MTDNPFSEAVMQIERAFDLRSGFLRELLATDDWSFVIKAHALLEATVSQLLTQHLGDARMHPIFEQLEMSNTRTGKLAFVNALELLKPSEQTFVRKFSELRNQLVHRITNVNFRFPGHIALLDDNQRRSWRDAYAFFVTAEPGLSRWRQKAIEDPRVTIWLGVLFLLGRIHLAIEVAKAGRQTVVEKLALLEQLLDDMHDPEDDRPDPAA